MLLSETCGNKLCGVVAGGGGGGDEMGNVHKEPEKRVVCKQFFVASKKKAADVLSTLVFTPRSRKLGRLARTHKNSAAWFFLFRNYNNKKESRFF